MGMNVFGQGRTKAPQDHARELIAGVDAALLVDALAAGVDRGWLVSFGTSRDGYAVRLGLIVNDDKQSVWCDDAMALQNALERLLEAATNLEAQMADTRPKKAPRAK